MIVERMHVPVGLVDDTAVWPYDVPAVAALLGEGIALEAPVTFLVGENGSGKSTLVEAFAEAWGADVRGGASGRRYSSELERSTLGSAMRLDRTGLGARMVGERAAGYFLRSETALDMFTRYEKAAPAYLEVSHGESYLQAFDSHFQEKGLYILDEPEAALSFTACLRLIGTLADVVEAGGQVLCATHSPVLTSMPGASILELGDHGVRRVDWADLELVRHWRAFLDEPGRYLRHL